METEISGHLVFYAVLHLNAKMMAVQPTEIDLNLGQVREACWEFWQHRFRLLKLFEKRIGIIIPSEEDESGTLNPEQRIWRQVSTSTVFSSSVLLSGRHVPFYITPAAVSRTRFYSVVIKLATHLWFGLIVGKARGRSLQRD